ncbi:acyl-CoA dehydrogenase (plasmid) [Paraburkholderia sp. PGU19]|uniref:acyl-CoA dehydrogenase family protein n=1 Tax=Paraburkholderia sp. PGU19 TaxID=2735434 RepID=UPI0015DA80E2|nr:acyl-CoA dehydrogenase family protein [Paraburkholderia sp. PGU19]BCG04919.1 acyl-CoA dehydrogenase [Paraburkholderia sp. PGU19]
MESGADPGFDEAAFRQEVSTFVRSELAVETRDKVENGLYLEKSDYVGWQKALYRRGWFAATWPVEFGGQGWSMRKEHAFLQECALNAAPMIIPYGVSMVGPVLYTYGNEDQKHRYLPGILSSDTWWCQGYSEPNAGSDLASLSTSAVRDGEYYIVNGTKMWTTEAHWADMMHCLVRTDSSGKKQQGISFLLIDMRTPGITVEPIVTLDGEHHTNQVFFDNVRVPAENLVGAEGEGWKIAKFLLSRERTSIADTGSRIRQMRQIKDTFAHYVARMPGVERTLMQARMAEIEASLTALVALERHYFDEWEAGRDDGVAASVLKVLSTELLQRMTEFWRDALGVYGACYDTTCRREGGLGASEPWRQAAAINYAYLYGRCWSIFGGSNEIQRNIIAGALLRR